MAFDLDHLIKELNRIPVTHKIAFAASCCERLLPNYQAFSVMEQWGDYAVLRNALNEAWKWLKGDALSQDYILGIVSQCEAVTPDTEDFSSVFTSSALDAATAVAETLQCCIDGDTERVASVASFAIDTIDMYVDFNDDSIYSGSTSEVKIQTHPFMLEELEKQAADIQTLKETTALTPDFLDTLRRSSESLGLQPIARGLWKPGK